MITATHKMVHSGLLGPSRTMPINVGVDFKKTKGCTKYQPQQIILTPSPMALKFNGFSKDNCFRFNPTASNSWMSVKFGLMPIHEGSGWGNMITDGPSTPLSNPSHLIIFLFMYIHMYILN